MRTILVTGSAGFIGFHLIQALLQQGDHVIGIDNLNDYYESALKHARLAELEKFYRLLLEQNASVIPSKAEIQGDSVIPTKAGIQNPDSARHCEERSDVANQDNAAATTQDGNQPRYQFIKMDLADRSAIEALFKDNQFDIVVNLGAQAGVRYSLDNPYAYVDSNLVGFVNILEGCRHNGVKHLVYASSSSVYGMNVKQPFSTTDSVDYPISLYAATKKSNEVMAHSYSHLFNIPTTGLRFFTVYGPWGRPDMAYFKFTKAILEGKPIDIYNQGNMKRDFTYIDDIVEGVIRVIDKVPTITKPVVAKGDGQSEIVSNATAPYKIYNIGNNQPVTLRRFITAIETACGKKAIENILPMQPGDVPITYADVDELIEDIGFKPDTSIEKGINKFVQWYKAYYHNN